MVKSGNCITTNLIMEKPTEEKNGVEVTIKEIKEISPYLKALNSIVFFPNIYIDGEHSYIKKDNINNIQIKKFDNFAAASESIYDKILLGNVLYPCNERLLSYESRDFLNNIEYSGIVIKFNIGEIGVTPNRESIIYSNETIAKIDKRIQDAKNELNKLVDLKFNKDYNDLYELWQILNNRIIYYPIDNSYEYSSKYGTYGYVCHIKYDKLSFKGTKINDSLKNVIKSFFYTRIINFKGLFHLNKLYQSKVPYIINSKVLMSVEHLLILTNSTKLSYIAKEWLCDNYKNYTIITSFTKEDLYNYLCSQIIQFKYICPNKDNVIVNYFYDYLMSKAKVLDLNSNNDFITYKEIRKKENKSAVRVENLIIYEQTEGTRIKKCFKNIKDCISYLKSKRKGIIISDLQDINNWYDIAKTRNFISIKARKDIVKALEDSKQTFFVDKEWLLTKDPVIVKFHTILQVFNLDNCPSKYVISAMLETIPSSLKEAFLDIINFNYKFCNNFTYMRAAKSPYIKIDAYTAFICKQLKKYSDAYRRIETEYIDYHSGNTLSATLVAAVIMKKKIYRVNYETYNNIRNNKLLNVLCKR